jgi:hypothetical protein
MRQGVRIPARQVGLDGLEQGVFIEQTVELVKHRIMFQGNYLKQIDRFVLFQ